MLNCVSQVRVGRKGREGGRETKGMGRGGIGGRKGIWRKSMGGGKGKRGKGKEKRSEGMVGKRVVKVRRRNRGACKSTGDSKLGIV